jgi:hypothetical protein
VNQQQQQKSSSECSGITRRRQLKNNTIANIADIDTFVSNYTTVSSVVIENFRPNYMTLELKPLVIATFTSKNEVRYGPFNDLFVLMTWHLDHTCLFLKLASKIKERKKTNWPRL